ncbi:hypothetical protein ElyMa_006929700, partial [Elysia marginata]
VVVVVVVVVVITIITAFYIAPIPTGVSSRRFTYILSITYLVVVVVVVGAVVVVVVVVVMAVVMVVVVVIVLAVMMVVVVAAGIAVVASSPVQAEKASFFNIVIGFVTLLFGCVAAVAILVAYRRKVRENAGAGHIGDHHPRFEDGHDAEDGTDVTSREDKPLGAGSSPRVHEEAEPKMHGSEGSVERRHSHTLSIKSDERPSD